MIVQAQHFLSLLGGVELSFFGDGGASGFHLVSQPCDVGGAADRAALQRDVHGRRVAEERAAVFVFVGRRDASREPTRLGNVDRLSQRRREMSIRSGRDFTGDDLAVLNDLQRLKVAAADRARLSRMNLN